MPSVNVIFYGRIYCLVAIFTKRLLVGRLTKYNFNIYIEMCKKKNDMIKRYL